MSGARCGDKSRATLPRRRPAPPTSTMPKLSAQAQLATAYYNLRAADALRDLLDRTSAEYKKTLDIVQNQFKAGYSVTAARRGDGRGASLHYRSDRLINVSVQRAQFEHAIAILVGRPPAELSIGPHPLSGSIPGIPVTVPSALLERRPDIAAAERTMQEQNALIGVAVAAYFPDISLSGLLGWTGTHPLPFNVANEVWSLGAAGTQVSVRRRTARRASGRRPRRLLAERCQLSSNRAHRVSAGRGPARRHSSPDASSSPCNRRRSRTQRRGGRRVFAPVRGWHGRVHRRGHGRDHIAGRTRRPN